MVRSFFVACGRHCGRLCARHMGTMVMRKLACLWIAGLALAPVGLRCAERIEQRANRDLQLVDRPGRGRCLGGGRRRVSAPVPEPDRQQLAGAGQHGRARVPPNPDPRTVRPPDTFQANGGWDLMTWVRYSPSTDSENKMEAIETLADAQGWRSVIPAPVLDTVSDNDSHLRGAAQHSPGQRVVLTTRSCSTSTASPCPRRSTSCSPSRQVQGSSASRRSRSDRRAAWTLSLLLFENLLNARNSGEFYRAFFTERKDPFSMEMRTALADLWKLLSFTNSDAPRLSWSDAVDMVLRDEAAMTIMGDWAKGYFLAHDKMPDVDFGQVAMPGTNDTFVFTTDTFGIPKGALNRAAAQRPHRRARLEGRPGGVQPDQRIDPGAKRHRPRRRHLRRHGKETIRAFRAALPDPNRPGASHRDSRPPAIHSGRPGGAGQVRVRWQPQPRHAHDAELDGRAVYITRARRAVVRQSSFVAP